MFSIFPFFALLKVATGSVLRKKMFSKNLQIYEKTPVPTKKETLAQLFSCEFCEMFKEHLFYRTPPGDYFRTVKSKLLSANSQ